MKKLSWTLFLVISVLSPLFAQVQQQKCPVVPIGINRIFDGYLEPKITAKGDQPGFCHPSLKGNPEGLDWKWKRIVVTDIASDSQSLESTYDKQGNMLTQLTQVFQYNIWVNFMRYTNSYDSKGNMVFSSMETWQANAWVNHSRYNMTYDSRGNMLTYQDEEWDGGTWTKAYRVSHSYDGNGNRLTDLIERGQGDSWVNFQNGFYSYDANNRLLSFYWAEWVSNLWINQNKVTYTYDMNGNRLTELDQFWTVLGWANHWSYTNAYDEGNHQTSSIKMFWVVSNWLNWTKFTWTYDTAGTTLTYLTSTWDPPDSSWDNTLKDTFAYDGNGNMICKLEQEWRLQAVWIDIYRWSYAYDDNGNSVAGNYMEWWSGDWYPGMGSLDLYSGGKIIFTVSPFYTYTATYESFLNGVNDVTNRQSTLKVYPNPARETISIQYDDVKGSRGGMVSVYDIHGRLLMQQSLPQVSGETDIRSLLKGIYFIRLLSSGTVQSAKFVKD